MYSIKLIEDSKELYSLEFEDIRDVFKEYSEANDRLYNSYNGTLYGLKGSHILYTKSINDLFTQSFTNSLKYLDAQDIYKLKNHWLEIAYNLHNNTVKSFLSQFKNDYTLPDDLFMITFTDGTYINIQDTNLPIGKNITFKFKLNKKGLLIHCTNIDTREVDLFMYELDDIETFGTISHYNTFIFTKDID